jgi:hypothetical protein
MDASGHAYKVYVLKVVRGKKHWEVRKRYSQFLAFYKLGKQAMANISFPAKGSLFSTVDVDK